MQRRKGWQLVTAVSIAVLVGGTGVAAGTDLAPVHLPPVDDAPLGDSLPPPPAMAAPLVRGQTDSCWKTFDSAGSFGNLNASACNGWPGCDDCCCGHGTWWENTSAFFASDAWRTRLDDDYPGNFGFRTGFNTGIGWWDSPVRLQVGGSVAGYDLDGRDGDIGADRLHNAGAENQLFGTFGAYKRSDIERGDVLAWGGVIDLMYDNRIGEEAHEVFLTQFRGYAGYAWDEANELGSWFTFRLNRDHYSSDTQGRVQVRSLDQINFFWHHNWAFGGDTWLYVGGAENPGNWTLGLTGQAPLSQSVALFGGFTYVIPSAPAGDPFLTGQNYSEAYWNVSFGIVWYPGFKAANRTVSGYSGLPLLNVADNGSFLIKAPTGDL